MNVDIVGCFGFIPTNIGIKMDWIWIDIIDIIFVSIFLVGFK
jgi:hypothetical protein